MVRILSLTTIFSTSSRTSFEPERCASPPYTTHFRSIDERVHAFLDLRMISSSVQSLMPYSLLDVILRATAAPQGPSVDEIVPVLAVRRQFDSLVTCRLRCG